MLVLQVAGRRSQVTDFTHHASRITFYVLRFTILGSRFLVLGTGRINIFCAESCLSRRSPSSPTNRNPVPPATVEHMMQYYIHTYRGRERACEGLQLRRGRPGGAAGRG